MIKTCAPFKIFAMSVLGLAILATGCFAQSLDLNVTRSGNRNFVVAFKAKRSPAIKIISALAHQSNYKLETSDTEVGKILDTETIDAEVVSTSLKNAVELVASACGLHGSIDANREIIIIRQFPEVTAEGADEFFRVNAQVSLDRALGANKEREVEYITRSADLDISGGKYEEAYTGLSKLASSQSPPPNLAELLLKSARAALAANKPSNARRITDILMEEYDNQIDHGKVYVLAARALIAQGLDINAVRVLEGIVRGGNRHNIDERDRIIAEILLAETHYRLGDFGAAIAVLGQVNYRHTRDLNRDLQDQVSLYMGICRQAQGDHRNAIHDLGLAVYSVPKVPGEKMRIRALILRAESYLETDDALGAKFSCAVAYKLKPEGFDLFRLRQLEGLALRDLYLYDEAIAKLFDVIMESKELIADKALRIKSAAAAIHDLGEILFKLGRYDEAREKFRQIRSQQEFTSRARYMGALCSYRSGDYKAALSSIQKISYGNDEEFHDDIRKLKGDCYMKLSLFEKAISAYEEGNK